MKMRSARSVLHQRLERQAHSAQLAAKHQKSIAEFLDELVVKQGQINETLKNQSTVVQPILGLTILCYLLEALKAIDTRDYGMGDKIGRCAESEGYRRSLDTVEDMDPSLVQRIDVVYKNMQSMETMKEDELTNLRVEVLDCARGYCQWLLQPRYAQAARHTSV